MSLSARITEPWLLISNDVGLRTVKHVENDTENKVVRGWLEEADHYVVTQKRRFVGLVGFTDETGSQKNSFSWYVGGGVSLSFAKSGRKSGSKYVCTKDRIEIEDYVTGAGWQNQQWELQGDFKPVPGSYYEEDVPDA